MLSGDSALSGDPEPDQTSTATVVIRGRAKAGGGPQAGRIWGGGALHCQLLSAFSLYLSPVKAGVGVAPLWRVLHPLQVGGFVAKGVEAEESFPK